MGLFDFVKDAGERIFGGGDDEPAEAVRTQADALADKKKAAGLENMVSAMGLQVEDLNVKLMDGKVTLSGSVPSQAEKEKLVLLVGNTQGIAQVDDDGLKVEKPEPEAVMYTVQSGDSLSKIAKAHYGDAMKYPVIFEANTPMLKDPNKIYPGQVLRIPPLVS